MLTLNLAAENDGERRKRVRLHPQAKLVIAEYLNLNGHKCILCQTPCPTPYLKLGCFMEQDHINGDRNDNRLANFRWLCKPCNIRERNKQKGMAERERGVERPWPSDASWEGRRHMQLEVDFEKAMDQLLDQGTVTIRQAEDCIAKICGTTQPVVRRWIDRELTPYGSFTVSDRQVSDGRKTRTEQFLGRKRVP